MSQTIFSDAKAHFIYQIANAHIREYPFPHAYISSLFPDQFYETLQNQMIASSDYKNILETNRVKGNKFKERFLFEINTNEINNLKSERRKFWTDFCELLNSQDIGGILIKKFGVYYRTRFGDQLEKEILYPDIMLIRDKLNYNLGPHTDHPTRTLAFLMYLPKTDDNPELGTSLYTPKDPNFFCPGGPHHDIKKFHKIFTAKYIRNSGLIFFKTNNSFHGVEKVKTKNTERHLIQMIIRAKPRKS